MFAYRNNQDYSNRMASFGTVASTAGVDRPFYTTHENLDKLSLKHNQVARLTNNHLRKKETVFEAGNYVPTDNPKKPFDYAMSGAKKAVEGISKALRGASLDMEAIIVDTGEQTNDAIQGVTCRTSDGAEVNLDVNFKFRLNQNNADAFFDAVSDDPEKSLQGTVLLALQHVISSKNATFFVEHNTIDEDGRMQTPPKKGLKETLVEETQSYLHINGQQKNTFKVLHVDLTELRIQGIKYGGVIQERIDMHQNMLRMQRQADTAGSKLQQAKILADAAQQKAIHEAEIKQQTQIMELEHTAKFESAQASVNTDQKIRATEDGARLKQANNAAELQNLTMQLQIAKLNLALAQVTADTEIAKASPLAKITQAKYQHELSLATLQAEVAKSGLQRQFELQALQAHALEKTQVKVLTQGAASSAPSIHADVDNVFFDANHTENTSRMH
jgi:SPFH domain / Band 7 family